MTEDLRGDLYEVATELACPPAGEDGGHLFVRLTSDLAEDCIGISDQLHITILDPVVHHLDEVP